jgi:hypothetical protein
MKRVSSFVIFASVVSQTTTRFDAPKPATYAFTEVSFALASITNMRSAGIATPARETIRSIPGTSAGAVSASGRNLKKSGATTNGWRNSRNTRIGSDASQKTSHQCSGDARTTA